MLAISILLTPILQLWTTSKDWGAFTTSYWHLLSTPGLTSYRPGLAPVAIAETVVLLGRAAYAVLVAVLFFQRRRAFCFHYVVLWLATVLTVAIDDLLVDYLNPGGLDPSTFGVWARIVLGGALWSWYLVRSRRVATTFTVALPRGVVGAPLPMPLPAPVDLP